MSHLPDVVEALHPTPFNLWSLALTTSDGPSADHLHHTFRIRVNNQDGVLTFASALDAEIYRWQLEAGGMSGWRRCPLEHIDLERVMSGLPQTERRLMLALGFFASDTNDLLLDQDGTLITPLLPVPYQMRHSLHGLSQLCINHDVYNFVERWWDQVGGDCYADQVRLTERWSDEDLARCASEALSKAPAVNLRQYHARWNHTGDGDECAVFSPDSGVWHFSTLRGPRSRAVH